MTKNLPNHALVGAVANDIVALLKLKSTLGFNTLPSATTKLAKALVTVKATPETVVLNVDRFALN
jgi:hypothetical protein